MKSEVTLYAINTGTFIGLKADHTYVLSPNHIFNCFGRFQNGRIIRSGHLSEKWATLVYGPDEKCQDCGTAAGLRIRYDGMCQNASNRVLALADEDLDVRGTDFNAVTTVMYGKYGFFAAQYIERLKASAMQLSATDPGEVTEEALQNVLQRIAYGQSADAELDVLHDDLKEQFSEQLPDITQAQREICRPIYSAYQEAREATFTTLPKTEGEQIAWSKLPQALQRPWLKCVQDLTNALGDGQFRDVFGVTPEVASGKLSGT